MLISEHKHTSHVSNTQELHVKQTARLELILTEQLGNQATGDTERMVETL